MELTLTLLETRHLSFSTASLCESRSLDQGSGQCVGGSVGWKHEEVGKDRETRMGGLAESKTQKVSLTLGCKGLRDPSC